MKTHKQEIEDNLIDFYGSLLCFYIMGPIVCLLWSINIFGSIEIFLSESKIGWKFTCPSNQDDQGNQGTTPVQRMQFLGF